ncbi:MAG: disulfide bond formation protein B [Gammaproteobacteria bacterium]|nr:disulfide bond formation protein B [Gammaproteobacteria bacterium]
MLKKILQMSANKWFWLAFLGLSISFEVIALFYQYVLDYMPCVLCIHVRIWVLAMIIVSLLALMVYRYWLGLFIMQLLMTGMTAGLLERSYQLFGTERGFLLSGCSMESGLPGWFALDDWLPSMFKVWEPCGYTPELMFAVTMAEALIVVSFILLVINALLTLNMLVNRLLKKNDRPG